MTGVSFSRDLVPVLRTNCATCHLTGSEAGNLALHPGAAYKNLVGVQSIESKWLRRYAHLVTSANTGAVLRDQFADEAPVALPGPVPTT